MVDLTVDLSVHLETQLAQCNIDLALQSGPFRSHASGSIGLGAVPMMWVASRSIAQRFSKNIDRQELAKLPIIAHARNTKHFEEINQHFSACQESRARVMQCNNLAACVQMAIDGFGVAPILKPMVEEAVKDGRLVKLNYAWQPSDLEFFARYDTHRASNLVVEAAHIASRVGNQFAIKY